MNIADNMVDAVILVAYIMISLIFGVLATKILKSNNKDEEGYFLAGRKMPGWLSGISFAVTCLNADVAPAYCGVAIAVGLPVAWFYLSRFGISVTLAGLLFFACWRQLGVSTGPEFFSVRFGGKCGKVFRSYTSVWSVIFGMVPWIGAGLLGVHKIFAPFFGYDAKWITLAVMIPVLLGYIWVSGFSGVLITDFIQTIVILISSFTLLFIVLYRYGGPENLALQVAESMGQKADQVLSLVPQKNHDVLGLFMVLGWFFLSTFGVGGNVGFEGQRVLASKNSKEAVKVSIWGQVMLIIMLLVLTLPVLGMLVDHPELYNASPSDREEVYGMMIAEYLPTGLKGLALAALAAAVMSTISSHLSYGGQTITNDVVHLLSKRKISSIQGVWIGRFTMLVIMVISIIVVYHSDSLIDIALLFLGLFSSVALFGWAQWWWWRVNIYSWFAAYICGPIIYFGVNSLMTNLEWWQNQVNIGPNRAQQMSMLHAAICAALNSSIWIILTLLTKPQNMELLKDFYKRAKPMGIWGPVRKALAEEDGIIIEKPDFIMFGGVLTTICGFAWVALLVLGLSKIYIGGYTLGVALLVAAVVVAFIFKKMFNWHLKRLAPEDM